MAQSVIIGHIWNFADEAVAIMRHQTQIYPEQTIFQANHPSPMIHYTDLHIYILGFLLMRVPVYVRNLPSF